MDKTVILYIATDYEDIDRFLDETKRQLELAMNKQSVKINRQCKTLITSDCFIETCVIGNADIQSGSLIGADYFIYSSKPFETHIVALETLNRNLQITKRRIKINAEEIDSQEQLMYVLTGGWRCK